MSAVLGLDIGGTRSRARVCADGELVTEADGSSASLTAAGANGARAALADLLGQLRVGPMRLGAGGSVDAVCAGSAGISVPGARQFLHDQLAPLTRRGPVVIVDDVALVLPAAGLTEGVAVICGTGSIAAGSYRGRAARLGGWGYLLGDEGGGYWIVRSALRVLLDRRDRGVPLGDLGDRLTAAVATVGAVGSEGAIRSGGAGGSEGVTGSEGTGGVDGMGGLHRLFYAEPAPRRWASYAPQVLDSADPAVAPIMSEAARALAGLAAGAASQLDAPAGIPVILAGGLTGHPAFGAAVREAIRAALPASEVRTLAEPPVAGAVALARAAIGQPGGRQELAEPGRPGEPGRRGEPGQPGQPGQRGLQQGRPAAAGAGPE